MDFRHTIDFHLVQETAIAPTNKNGTDAGWDLYIPMKHMKNSLVLKPNNFLIVDMGISIYLPEGVVGMITEKSRGFHKVIGGIVDPYYTGTVRVKMVNPYRHPILFSGGDAIAQILFMPFVMVKMRESDVPVEVSRPRSSDGIVNQGAV